MAFDSLTAISITRSPLPLGFLHIPAAIALWIDATVPCIVGKQQSRTVTDLIVKHLRSRGVSEADISAALAKSAYTFAGAPSGGFTLQIRVPTGPTDTGPQMTGYVPEGSAEFLDGQFIYARNGRDLKKMKLLAYALKKLLDQQDENRRKESRRNAPNLSRFVREGKNGENEVDEDDLDGEAAGGGADADADAE